MTDAAILQILGNFSEAEINEFTRYRHNRVFKKGDLLVPAGSVNQSIYFLKQGALVQYQNLDEDNRQYENLYVANDWVFNPALLTGSAHSQVCLQAFTPCELVELTLNSVHRLISFSPAFFALNRVMRTVTDRLSFLQTIQTPDEKYEALLRARPEIVQTFPLKIIASYLKISPETLSRVRSRV